MCDTFVATASATADGSALFAKNSDREPGEAQAVELVPAAEHAPGSRVACTHLTIAQIRRTRAVLLCRPFWIWGAEMGANDAGVVIGNEAVFTRAPQQDVGLLGMDLVRLALERGASSRECVSVITDLLEEHGQGGAAGFRLNARYHNSFLLADPGEAWVLETADRAWVAQRVSGVRSISNGLTIRDDWELASDGLAARAREMRSSPGKGRVDFARTFANPLITWGAAARRRRCSTETFLQRETGKIDLGTAMRALRRHGDPDRPERVATAPRMTVCGHASWLPTRRQSQTTGSLVSRLGEPGWHFVTATAAPCTSVFKPATLDSGALELGPTPSERFDERALYWRHERLHRLALRDLPAFLGRFGAQRDELEARFVRHALDATDTEARGQASRAAFAEAAAFEDAWFERLQAEPGRLPGLGYRAYWAAQDRRSGLGSAPP